MNSFETTKEPTMNSNSANGFVPAPMEYVNMFSGEHLNPLVEITPPDIIKDSYTLFGQHFEPNQIVIESLESQGLKCLYSNSKRKHENELKSHRLNTNYYKRELKKLNHSILVAYLDLLEILVKAPNSQVPSSKHEFNAKTLREQKLEDIELLFKNMHHLINELRPHQARDNIICVLETQKQQRYEIAQKFRMHLFKISDLLQTCIQSIQTPASSLKSGQYLDELNSMLSNASSLANALDDAASRLKINGTKIDHALKTNGFSHEISQLNGFDHDDRKPNILVGINSTPNDIDTATKPQKECDTRDAMLCNLIDEFLIKEF